MNKRVSEPSSSDHRIALALHKARLEVDYGITPEIYSNIVQLRLSKCKSNELFQLPNWMVLNNEQVDAYRRGDKPVV